MRRRAGNQLVPNEKLLLAAALRLKSEGVPRLYGYDLFATLREWQGFAPMDHGTLYRCLRNLEDRAYFTAEVELADTSTRRVRVYYSLTESGTEASRAATEELAASPYRPKWLAAAAD